MDYLIFLLCLLLAWIGIHLLISTAKKGNELNPRTLPPGPTPLPIFGNLLSLIGNGTNLHVSLTQLAKTYGPLMTLHLGQVPTVVISSSAMAKEALHKNDISFSNRMIIDAVRALNHHANSLVFLPPTSQWRKLRKTCNSHVFSASKLDSTQTLRRNKIKDLLFYVQKCSEEGMVMDIGQAAFTTTLNLLSGTFFSVDLGDPSSGSDLEFRDIVRDMLDEVGKINLANYFPLLRKMDPQGIRRRVSVNLSKMVDLFNTMINQRLRSKWSSDSMQGNDVLGAILGINHEKNEEIEPSNIPDLLVDLFVAGTDTISGTLEWAMAELLNNPKKMKKAQAELKEIVGKGNLVEELDIARLPYLQVIVKETIRLHPGVPFLVPRRVYSDVKLLGFTVPKNAHVLVNVCAIGREPNIWENPNSFKPERFMGSEIEVKGCDFELIPFGAGRRICPGLPLAIRIIPLMLGSLIHEFDWKLEGGISPENMDMEDKFGFTLHKAQPLRAIPVRI